MEHTSRQYDAVIHDCKDIFLKKNADYGTSWRILRSSTITDQIYIKAQRIRGIETKGFHLVNEGIEPEYRGIVNYALMGIIQLRLNNDEPIDMPAADAEKYFNEIASETKSLMMQKNHDYGEAWREMRISSFTDMILVRLMRIRQIEDNQGKTLVSEGIEANYMDIINYAIFALIRLSENQE